jgi:hypothetical protein
VIFVMVFSLNVCINERNAMHCLFSQSLNVLFFLEMSRPLQLGWCDLSGLGLQENSNNVQAREAFPEVTSSTHTSTTLLGWCDLSDLGLHEDNKPTAYQQPHSESSSSTLYEYRPLISSSYSSIPVSTRPASVFSSHTSLSAPSLTNAPTVYRERKNLSRKYESQKRKLTEGKKF